MDSTYYVDTLGLEVQHFRDTLLQHLGNVKKSVAERTRHQRKYERKVNKRQMQTQESNIDTGKALDADLVDTESIRTDSTVSELQEKVFALCCALKNALRSYKEIVVDLRKVIDSCTSKGDSEPHMVQNCRYPIIFMNANKTLDESQEIMVAEKAWYLQKTIVKVDSQMMIQKNDV
ncbi:hypothetical protein Tco_0655701 [Tanacetum coccineum]|uniref:Uncharacterized protein n=1 Tax=Tanacetum coccineum TaxID=301880 RepID=A0ABQ4X6R4_9ASTR